MDLSEQKGESTGRGAGVMTRRDSPRALLRGVTLKGCNLLVPATTVSGDRCWGATLLIPRNNPRASSKIDRIVWSAAQRGVAKFGQEWLEESMRVAIRNHGDKFFAIRGKSRFPIETMDSQRNHVDLRDYEMEGALCTICVSAYPYESHGYKGINFALRSVWITHLPNLGLGSDNMTTIIQEQAS